ncbi:hypothetical protein FRC12_004394 [Ceratobasidium sp. 428]|nr:hypothetical protein FRC12_004394 [Ceratobasidium sp. 428]
MISLDSLDIMRQSNTINPILGLSVFFYALPNSTKMKIAEQDLTFLNGTQVKLESEWPGGVAD